MQPQPKRAAHLAALALVASLLLLPATASGGVRVSGTCGLWQPYNTSPAQLAVYPACPTLVARNALGGFTTATANPGGWTLTAPAGTMIKSLNLQGSMRGLHGWQAAIFLPNGRVLEGCPGATCPGASKTLSLSWLYSGSLQPSVILRVRCGSLTGCPNNALNGQITLTNSVVELADHTPPSVRITGGPLAGSGWRRGVSSLVFVAGDGTGIKSVQAFLDGKIRADLPRSCTYVGTLVPCPNGGGTLSIDTTGAPDGAHTVTVRATDAEGLITDHNLIVHTDNTAPGSPIGASLTDGDGWKPTNSFAVQWSDPVQQASPIVAVDYALCPASSAATHQTACVFGSRTGSNIRAIEDLAVPGPGIWRLAVHLRDAAGNSDPGTAVVIPNLRYDPTPPDAHFAPMNPNNPTQIRVVASDAVSGIAAQELQIQRQGTNVWQDVATTATTNGFSGTLDDGVLPRGTYRLRATVVDEAGNERTIDSFPSGVAATVSLPVRIKTNLSVGKVELVLARNSRHGKKHYRRILLNRPWSRYGHTVSLHGRLTTPGGNPVAGATVDVSQRVDLPGSAWHPIAEVTTSRTGRFVFKALRGPSRLIRFRYAGTGTIRSRVTTVDLRVHAATTIHVDHHAVVNGDTVLFSGRLKTRPVPPEGKLVELEVYTRGLWRIFAQPRTSPSGRWSFSYRFQAVTGRVRFRFRARIRKEATYPFDLGISRDVRVTVRGA